jgi:hypothetical protein
MRQSPPQEKLLQTASCGEDFSCRSWSRAIPQLSRQRYDNLAAIGSALFAKHFFGYAFTDAPLEQRQPRIDRDGDSSTCLGDELTQILDQSWRSQWSAVSD